MLVYKSLRKRQVVAHRPPARPHMELDKSHKTTATPERSQNSSDGRTATTESPQTSTILSLTVLSEFRFHPRSPRDAYGHIAGRSVSLSGPSQNIEQSLDTSVEERANRV